jgi:phage head maturation protease
MPKDNVLREEIATNRFRIIAESFTTESAENGGVIVKGLALPFDRISRNGFTYVAESITATHKTLEGAPVLFNHNADRPIGHVEASPIGTGGMEYRMNIDPAEEDIVRKLRRGDIRHVSIQCQYDPDKSFMDESGVTHAYISEFLELSVVTIPGFADTTAMVVESLRSKKVNTMQTENVVPPVVTEAEEPKKDDVPAQEPEKKEQEDPLVAVQDRLAKCEEAIAALLKTQEADTKDDEAPAAPDPDEDKKREEAIAKDKKTILSESIGSSPRVLTERDLRDTFNEVLNR